MSESPLRTALRFDSGGWRQFAELGCVYGPEWWKRASPPVIAAIIYGLARDRREAVGANQRQVRGPGRRWREAWDTYRVFASFARSLTEGLEQWGPRPRPIDLRIHQPEIVEQAMAEHRGLVVVTGHFGSWDIGARVLSRLGRPVNMVVGREPNPTVREFMHKVRTRHGFRVIYSDVSLLAGLPILQALRRDEVVGMQIEPWGTMRGSHPVTFCGRTTLFQLGPFAIARAARSPLVPVFAIRAGIRSYDLHVMGRFDPRTRAESVAALEATAHTYEGLVRAHPEQWLMFERVWRTAAEALEEPPRRVAGGRPG